MIKTLPVELCTLKRWGVALYDPMGVGGVSQSEFLDGLVLRDALQELLPERVPNDRYFGLDTNITHEFLLWVLLDALQTALQVRSISKSDEHLLSAVATYIQVPMEATALDVHRWTLPSQFLYLSWMVEHIQDGHPHTSITAYRNQMGHKDSYERARMEYRIRAYNDFEQWLPDAALVVNYLSRWYRVLRG